MKVLCNWNCNCWRKSDTCVACYMANVEDWNQIHAIAMSAEAQRRLEEDLRFLESINVWHLVNLRSNPNPHQHHHDLYGYPSAPVTVDSLTMVQVPHHHNNHNGGGYPGGGGYTHPQNYNQLPPPPPPPSSIMGGNHPPGKVIPSPGYGTSLPYPDLIIHTRELTPQGYYEPPSMGDDYKDFSPVIQNGMSLQENSRLKHLALLPKEPDDYDAEDHDHHQDPNENERLSPEHLNHNQNENLEEDGRKTVKFTPDTIFVERDMNSPFWRAFTERRRIRRINRQRKQLNAQIAHASYQPSIVEIVKTAFGKSSNSNNTNSNNNNNNNNSKDVLNNPPSIKKKGSFKSEVIVYDNNSQITNSEKTHQYVYSSSQPPQTSSSTQQDRKKGSKFLQFFACQCCSAPTQSS